MGKHLSINRTVKRASYENTLKDTLDECVFVIYMI